MEVIEMADGSKKVKETKLDPEYVEMVSKSIYKSYTDKDKRKLGMEPTAKTPVYTQAMWTMYRFDSPKKTKRPPLLVIPSLINRNYIMDLLPGHSIMESLVNAGNDVFIVDWGTPDPSYGHIGLAYYVSKFLKRAVRQVKKITGADKINLMGQCLGGTFCAMYAAHPELKKDLNKLLLLTTPLNFENSGLLAKWTNSEGFDIDKLTSAVGAVVPPEFFHSSFPLLMVRGTLAKYKNLLERFEIPDFKKVWQALDIWSSDNVPFTLQGFRDLIKVFYLRNAFYTEGILIEDKVVRVFDITTPTLSVAAKDDHVFTETAARAILESRAAKENKVEHHVMGAGHVTLVAAHPVRTETYKIFNDYLAAE